MEKIKKFNTGYTQVVNTVLYDKDISLRAKGLYAYLFSKPDGWQFHMEVMEAELKESKGQMYTAIKELIEKQYVQRKQINENGVFGGIIYEFLNPCGIEPCTEKTAYGKTPTHNNIDNISNTDNKDINYMSEFEEFWELYKPVITKQRCVEKGSKKDAYKKFEKIRKSGTEYKELKDGMLKYMTYCHTNNILTCGVSVFLNQERWKNTYETERIKETINPAVQRAYEQAERTKELLKEQMEKKYGG